MNLGPWNRLGKFLISSVWGVRSTEMTLSGQGTQNPEIWDPDHPDPKMDSSVHSLVRIWRSPDRGCKIQKSWRRVNVIFGISARNAAECDGRELCWCPLRAFCGHGAEGSQRAFLLGPERTRWQIRNLRKKCCRMRWSRAPLVPIKGFLWPRHRELTEGLSAGPGNEATADSESTQEMPQNAMVESSTGAR